jgi:hypothetical protein
LIVSFEDRALNEVDIHVAIRIEIEEGRASAHHFRQKKLSARTIVVTEFEPGLRRDFVEDQSGCARFRFLTAYLAL